jgi:hypothetical protein
MIAFYIVGLSTKALRNAPFVDSTDSIIEKMDVMARTATVEQVGLKGALILSYHSSFEALVYKQEGVRIVVMAQ